MKRTSYTEHMAVTIDTITNTVRFPDESNRYNIARGMKSDDAINKLETLGFVEGSRRVSEGILQIVFTRTVS